MTTATVDARTVLLNAMSERLQPRPEEELQLDPLWREVRRRQRKEHLTDVELGERLHVVPRRAIAYLNHGQRRITVPTLGAIITTWPDLTTEVVAYLKFRAQEVAHA